VHWRVLIGLALPGRGFHAPRLMNIIQPFNRCGGFN